MKNAWMNVHLPDYVRSEHSVLVLCCCKLTSSSATFGPGNRHRQPGTLLALVELTSRLNVFGLAPSGVLLLNAMLLTSSSGGTVHSNWQNTTRESVELQHLHNQQNVQRAVQTRVLWRMTSGTPQGS